MIAFIAGLLIGGAVGALAMALVAAGKDDREGMHHEEKPE